MSSMAFGIVAVEACIRVFKLAMEGSVKKRGTQGRQECRYPGLKEHARQLGVNRSYLSKVLYGERISPGLVKRYEELTGRKVNLDD